MFGTIINISEERNSSNKWLGVAHYATLSHSSGSLRSALSMLHQRRMALLICSVLLSVLGVARHKWATQPQMQAEVQGKTLTLPRSRS